VLGQLDGIQQQLKEVREEWEQAQEQIGAEQTALQAKWQDLTLRVAQYQAELDYLSDKASREALAFKRATRYAIDHLVEELPSASPGVAEELDRMAELNRQTDAYEEGLGAVVSLLALIVGISEGLGRFNESVKGLVEEQRMHGAHLPKLSVSVPDNVLAFHEHWDSLAKAVRDDRHLSAHPADFVAAVQPTIEQRLDERDIRAMFEALGTALQRATASWKG